VIDLHNHIIPAVDDGARSAEESLEILKHYVESGFSAICATSHIRSALFDNDEENIRRHAPIVEEIIKREGLPLAFRYGAEYYYDDSLLEKLDNPKDLLTLDPEGRYLLVEFDYKIAPPHLKEFVFKLGLKGLRMVMAHPERYRYIYKDFDFAEELIAMGVIMQGTLGSLMGEMGSRPRKHFKEMLKADLFQIISTDCHRMPSCKKMLFEGIEIVKKEVGTEKSLELLQTTPALIYKGQPF